MTWPVRIERHPQGLNRRRADAVEPGIVGPGQDHLDRTPQGLCRQRRRDRVVAVQPAAKSAAHGIGAHQDLAFIPPKRNGQLRQDQALPLVARVDFHHAIHLDSQRIHGLHLEMQDCRGGKVASICRCGGGKGRVGVAPARVQQRAARGIGDQRAGAVLDLLLRPRQRSALASMSP